MIRLVNIFILLFVCHYLNAKNTTFPTLEDKCRSLIDAFSGIPIVIVQSAFLIFYYCFSYLESIKLTHAAATNNITPANNSMFGIDLPNNGNNAKLAKEAII